MASWSLNSKKLTETIAAKYTTKHGRFCLHPQDVSVALGVLGGCGGCKAFSGKRPEVMKLVRRKIIPFGIPFLGFFTLLSCFHDFPVANLVRHPRTCLPASCLTRGASAPNTMQAHGEVSPEERRPWREGGGGQASSVQTRRDPPWVCPSTSSLRSPGLIQGFQADLTYFWPRPGMAES